jgi:hypothetical protein
MEKLTLASMEHLESIVVFVLDLSGSSGPKSSVNAQLQVSRPTTLNPVRTQAPYRLSFSRMGARVFGFFSNHRQTNDGYNIPLPGT